MQPDVDLARPIHTYNGQGETKCGLCAQNIAGHAVIHTSDTKPYTLREEKGIIKRPIEVIKATGDQQLHPMSRLNFLKSYTVEYNEKVMDVGGVSAESMPDLLEYWQPKFNSSSRRRHLYRSHQG